MCDVTRGEPVYLCTCGPLEHQIPDDRRNHRERNVIDIFERQRFDQHGTQCNPCDGQQIHTEGRGEYAYANIDE